MVFKYRFGKLEVCTGEIRSIRHPVISKTRSSELGMNGLRIIRMNPRMMLIRAELIIPAGIMNFV